RISNGRTGPERYRQRENTTNRIQSSASAWHNSASNFKNRSMRRRHRRSRCAIPSRTNLSDLVIPELVPKEDLRTRLSTLAAVWTRDTRDNPLDAHTGLYDSVEFNVNPAILGSNTNFGKLLAQAAFYKNLNGIVWANSVRLGFVKATSGNHVPLSQ